MKLYTEEQMIQAYDAGFQDFREGLIGRSYHVVDNITPIELPSDEEIRINTQFATNDFYWGAKWMKKLILNQNK